MSEFLDPGNFDDPDSGFGPPPPGGSPQSEGDSGSQPQQTQTHGGSHPRFARRRQRPTRRRDSEEKDRDGSQSPAEPQSAEALPGDASALAAAIPGPGAAGGPTAAEIAALVRARQRIVDAATAQALAANQIPAPAPLPVPLRPLPLWAAGGVGAIFDGQIPPPMPGLEDEAMIMEVIAIIESIELAEAC